MDIHNHLCAEYHDTVLQEWTDYNGHMNVAYYVLAFDRASDSLFEKLGCGEEYLNKEQKSLFAVEMNVSYMQEMNVNDPMLFSSQLLGFGEKKIHIFHRMYNERDGYLAATNEILLLHIDMAERRSTAMSAQLLTNLQELLDGQAEVTYPDNAGRVFGV